MIDSDPRRRAKAAFDFSKHVPSQVYESVKEFIEFGPREGIVFVNDDCDGDPLSQLHAHFTRMGKALPVALYARTPQTSRVVEAVLSGAVDYLTWPIDEESIHTVLEQIVERFASLDVAQGRRIDARKKVALLSTRERHTLQLLVEGNSTKDTAQILGISPRTVEIHRGNVLRKLGAGSSADAVRIGLYAGIEDEELAFR
ncbi:response regulator transcription factor [Tsuneonella litorea]|uniref:response regulator transcription factor n=1 Tax=Tsuneonella litorea TaxID=2976475 RepID=UPI0021A66B38|nr:LuxR C-terminal-related transcriptional regulator [Tsuneonella litorea]